MMYGSVPYSVSAYASLLNNILFVAACIHIDSQKIYGCEVSTFLTYTASITTELCSNVDMSLLAGTTNISQSMVYLTDVNIVAGEC